MTFHLRQPVARRSLAAPALTRRAAAATMRTDAPRIMPAPKAVTLKDIARRAGVSVMTASNALNGVDKGVRSDARARAERIRQIARSMGYRPNAAARAVRERRFRSIGLISSTVVSHSVISAALPAIQAACREMRCSLTLAQMPDETLTDEVELPQILTEWSVDGLLINYAYEYPEAMHQVIAQNALPAVWINVKQPLDCVHPDDHGGGALATRSLIELGHRRIAYVTFAHSLHYSHADRAAGYTAAMATANLEPVVQRAQRYLGSGELAGEATRLLRARNRPTAIVTYAARDAITLCWHARELGLKVPQDLSIVTFAPEPASVAGIDIATVLLPMDDLGRRAVEMLSLLLDGQAPGDPEAIHAGSVQGGPLPGEALPCTLYPGHTLAPPGSWQA